MYSLPPNKNVNNKIINNPLVPEAVAKEGSHKMGRRQFTAQFKTKIVLEILREEKQLGELAAEHGFKPQSITKLEKNFWRTSDG